MALPATLSNWRTLTRVVNTIKPDASFIRNLVFPGAGRTFSTPDVRFDVISGGREVAPFVRRGGEAIRIRGYGHSRRTLETPNIKLKMEIDPESYAQTAAAGTIQEILAGSNSMEASARAQVARDLTRMKRMGTNTLEWLCCQALNGTITYAADEGEDAWTVDFLRTAGHDETLTGDFRWWTGTAYGSTSDPLEDFRRAKHKINKATGLNCNIVVLGEDAASALIKNPQWKSTYAASLTSRLAGNEVQAVQLTADIRPDGAVYEGIFGQLPVFAYVFDATNWAGTTANLIDPKSAYFIAATPAAENEIYYGGIYDMKTMNQSYAIREFSKAWEQDDPSLGFLMYQSRPLPVLHRPDAILRMVVSA